MSSNAKAAQIVQAGAPSLSKADEDAMCKAFADAVQAWCGRKKNGPAGQFNDEFMGQCQNQGLWDRMKMEVPAAHLKGGGSAFLFRMARGTGAAAAGARKVLRLASRLTNVTSPVWRFILAGAIGRGMKMRAMFPDGALLVNGPPRRYIPVEVKGPYDNEGPGQFDKYRDLDDPQRELAIVSCDTCPGCGPDNTCP